MLGYDHGVCTVTFDNTALCDYVLSVTNQGDIYVKQTIVWEGPGPSTYDGVITGGTAKYLNATGGFHAVVLPNGDVQVDATITVG